ncbi:class I SAM-dependent methyltransferase [Candidatus Woesebacteria bacterium]|nr:class I SAM-dependent methyltransferase [Candidatus Woesebacteria bacterium]
MNKIDYITKMVSQWNDAMYQYHPTPYTGKIAGIIERKRVDTIIELANITKKDSVLEIGCERGQILSKIESAKRIVGLDVSKVALDDAKKMLGDKAELIFADAEKPIRSRVLKKNSFDVVICSQTLEHVANPWEVLKNIHYLAKDNARIVISVPNELFMLRIKRLMTKFRLMDKLFPNIEPEISEWHLQIFTHEIMEKQVGKLFKIEKLDRAFNVYLIYLLSKV